MNTQAIASASRRCCRLQFNVDNPTSKVNTGRGVGRLIDQVSNQLNSIGDNSNASLVFALNQIFPKQQASPDLHLHVSHRTFWRRHSDPYSSACAALGLELYQASGAVKNNLCSSYIHGYSLAERNAISVLPTIIVSVSTCDAHGLKSAG